MVVRQTHAAIKDMPGPSLTDAHTTAATLWRGARRAKRHTGPPRLLVGWKSPSAPHAERLRKALATMPGVALADREGYEPENDPLETIVYFPAQRASLAAVEQHLPSAKPRSSDWAAPSMHGLWNVSLGGRDARARN